MKIVINRCYGGFSLSARACMRIAELQGRECYLFKTNWDGGEIYYQAITLEEIEGTRSYFRAYDVPLEELNKHKQSIKEWHLLPEEEKLASNAWHDAHGIEERPQDRTDKLLIQVVEELGTKANGQFAELEVVEIPDGIEYEIDEYDGIERVHEVHRSWP